MRFAEEEDLVALMRLVSSSLEGLHRKEEEDGEAFWSKRIREEVMEEEEEGSVYRWMVIDSPEEGKEEEIVIAASIYFISSSFSLLFIFLCRQSQLMFV